MIVVDASRAKYAAAARRVRRALVAAAPRLTKRPVHAVVFLITDGEMRRVNRRTRGKDQPTNVLSFAADSAMPHPEVRKGTRVLGEMFLAPDLIVRRKEDLVGLAVHGLLHLFGYTHGRTRDRMKMERKEASLGYGLHGNRIRYRLEHGTRRGRRNDA